MVRAFGMYPNIVGSSPPRAEKFLFQKLWHFHTSIRSWVEHECCYLHTVGIQMYLYKQNICMIQWHVDRMWWAHVNCKQWQHIRKVTQKMDCCGRQRAEHSDGKGGPLLRFIRALFCLKVCNCGTHEWTLLDIWTDSLLHQTYLMLHKICCRTTRHWMSRLWCQ